MGPGIRIALLTGFALAISAAMAAAPQTFTRRQIGRLTPETLAARILGGVAGKARAVEVRDDPTGRPWLQQVQIDLPAVKDDDYGLCRRDRLIVQFQPVHFIEAYQHAVDSKYDPPVKIRNVESENRYADTPGSKRLVSERDADCAALDERSFFYAPDRGSAVQAIMIFGLFRAEAERADSDAAFHCIDLVKKTACGDGWRHGLKGFHYVLAVQTHADLDGQTEVVALMPDDAAQDQASLPPHQLWLTVRIDASTERLVTADYVQPAPAHSWENSP